MKKNLRRIVAILLAITVIGCAVWYFSVYDRDFARDLLISQARQFDSQGRYELAAWFYDQAYLYADNDSAVAIELAQQYKENGNYTKAEYTLTKAISNGATAELYIALCQTFVEQDKLLDAVNMLDKIADPAIKAEIDALRPDTPTVSVAPNFYTQYLSVEITGGSGTLLYSTDCEYPSIEEDLYTAPIQLGQGETTIYTLTVGENGLVSPLGIYGYTVGGVVEMVTFADAAMEAEVRNVLGFDAETAIYTDDLWTITEFSVPLEAEVYSDLSKLAYLTELTIYSAKSEELDCLGALTQLEDLFITGCDVNQQTLTAIASLPELKKLTIAQCGMTDIAPLAAAHGLEYLDLSHNSIRDISALSAMAELENLYLAHNALTDLSALSGLSSLTYLNVSYNSITSLAPICGITSLTRLNVSNNLLPDLSAVDRLSNLTVLDAGYNKLTDVTVLGLCTGLTELNISNNQISDISALADLNMLKKLDCSYNSITALPGWTSTAALVSIDASYNQISDMAPLGGLESLNTVNMDYNTEISSAEPLASCPNLIQVNLFGTKVTNVDMLTQQSIVVRYNPTDVSIDITEPTEEPVEEE